LLDTGSTYNPHIKAFVNSNHDINDRTQEHSVLWKAVNEYYSTVRSASTVLCGLTRKSSFIKAQQQFEEVCFSIAITGGTQPTHTRIWNNKDARTRATPQSSAQQSQASPSKPDFGMDYQTSAVSPSPGTDGPPETRRPDSSQPQGPTDTALKQQEELMRNFAQWMSHNAQRQATLLPHQGPPLIAGPCHHLAWPTLISAWEPSIHPEGTHHLPQSTHRNNIPHRHRTQRSL
jgi:hypothetical protein